MLGLRSHLLQPDSGPLRFVGGSGGGGANRGTYGGVGGQGNPGGRGDPTNSPGGGAGGGGAGSVGGTIRFIPNKPSLEEETMDLRAKLSSTDHSSDTGYDFNLTANIPMSDTLAFRGTVGYEKLSGFIDAIGLVAQEGTPRDTGAVILADPSDIVGSPAAAGPSIKDSNEGSRTYIRASVLSKPSDTVEIGLNFNYQEVKADNRYEHNPNYGSGENYVTHKAHTDPSDGDFTLIDLDVEVDLGFARLTSNTGVSNMSLFGVSDSSGFLRTTSGTKDPA
mgnify:CR=1 FL=1